jgi:HK97 family phage major capsid protein
MRTMAVISSVLLALAAALVDPLYRIFRWAMQETAPLRHALPRLVKFAEHPFQKRGYAKLLAGGRGCRLAQSLAVATVLLLVACTVIVLTGTDGGLLLAAPPAMLLKVQTDLKALTEELGKGQEEILAGTASEGRRAELTTKAKEAEELQGRLDEYNRNQALLNRSREVVDPSLPADTKTRKGRQKRIITTPGHLFVSSDAFKYYRQNGKQGWSANVDVKSIRGGTVRLEGESAEEFETKAFDPATLSDLGTDAIIEYDRDPEVVRYEEPEILTIRDILSVRPTTKDSIRFVRHTATSRAAASQAGRGAPKPYLTVTATVETVGTETIAVLSKVTEQDIDDAPRLIGFINDEMRLDVKVEEERQLVWGDGTGNDIEGIFAQGVETTYEFNRAGVGDTIVDTIRKMQTDLRKRRVIGSATSARPTALMIDPLDWETAELLKSSADDRYLWAVITDVRGPRIWSMRVVESDAMTNPATGERRLLMGDFVRGATLYDRHDVRLAIGFVDDDFARNLRTLRAEERVALAVKRPWAFSYAVTQEAGS